MRLKQPLAQYPPVAGELEQELAPAAIGDMPGVSGQCVAICVRCEVLSLERRFQHGNRPLKLLLQPCSCPIARLIKELRWSDPCRTILSGL